MYVKLNKKDLEKCQEFANKCVHTNNYSQRGQSNIEKRKQDIVNGKMAELATAQALSEMGLNVNKPDFAIYSAKHKSHGEDLTLNGRKIEIKSQTIDSMEKYGASWLLETNAIEKIKDHVFVFCTIINNGVFINNICEFDELEFGRPRLPQLKTKSAIYYIDILTKKLGIVHG